MPVVINYVQWLLGAILILSSIGVVAARKPLYSGLSFLATLLALAALFLDLSAQFIAVLQILVYAGAILVIFIFVIVLFQDAHEQLSLYKPLSNPFLIYLAAALFVPAIIFLGSQLFWLEPVTLEVSPTFGTVRSIGEALYVDFFFPFEAVVLLFLVAIVGSLYVAKREK